MADATLRLPPMGDQCGCRACHPERFPSGGRQGEGHVAARFGDLDHLDLAASRATLDGVEVPASEAIPGDHGTVVLLHDPWGGEPERVSRTAHPCPCGSLAFCQVVLHGVVAVRLKARR